MKRLILLILLVSACSSPTGKEGKNAAPNNATNNSGTNNSGTNNSGTNNSGTNNSGTNNGATNNLPAGACAHAEPLPPGAKTCRSGADCSDGCGYVDSGPGCGTVFTPQQDCANDAECGDGQVCLRIVCGPNDLCCQGEGSGCADSCATTGCEDGFDCGDDGHCAATPCTDGFDCMEGSVCDPERANAYVDDHGCTPEACVTDGAACPDGLQCDDGTAGNPNGTCLPIPCGSDDDCHPNEVCTTPPTPYSDGCKLADCSTDDDCGCGACIDGQCQPRIFVCLSPAAP